MGPAIKTAVILGYACNNSCRFCYVGDKKNKFKPLSTKGAKEILREGRERGSDFVDFSGGEPTIRKDLEELISYSKNLDFQSIAITTNGRMLSSKAYCKRLVEAGLNSVVFSVHGHKAELHDYLTNVKGSFGQLKQGFRNFRNLKKDGYICTNTVILKQNFRVLPLIAKFSIEMGANAMEFIFPHPRGNAYSDFEELVPFLGDLVEVIPETVNAGLSAGVKHCHFRYLPLCYMHEFKNFLSEYATRDFLREQHFGPEFSNLEVERGRSEQARVKGPQCEGCRKNRDCEGIFREYAEKRGFGELVPMP